MRILRNHIIYRCLKKNKRKNSHQRPNRLNRSCMKLNNRNRIKKFFFFNFSLRFLISLSVQAIEGGKVVDNAKVKNFSCIILFRAVAVPKYSIFFLCAKKIQNKMLMFLHKIIR